RDAARDASAFARTLDRMVELRKGTRPGARLKLPVLRLDDGGESSGERRLSHRQEDRVGLPEHACAQCGGSGPVHQTSRVSRGMAGHPEVLVSDRRSARNLNRALAAGVKVRHGLLDEGKLQYAAGFYPCRSRS